DAKAQYYYRVLHFRYIEQIGQIELASQLGISERQLRRDQNSAMELLAELLWDEFGREQAEDKGVPNAVGTPGLDHEAIDAEVAWLQRQIPSGISYLEHELAEILHDVGALVRQYQVAIHVD